MVVPNGRATQAEYFWFLYFWRLLFLGIFVTFTVYSPEEALRWNLGLSLHEFGLKILVFALIMLPAFNLIIRRLHDSNKSGYWAVFALIPFFGIIAELIIGFRKPTDGMNDYGPDPRVPLMP